MHYATKFSFVHFLMYEDMYGYCTIEFLDWQFHKDQVQLQEEIDTMISCFPEAQNMGLLEISFLKSDQLL